MNQQAFDLVARKVEEALAEQGFASQGAANGKDGFAALFLRENLAYSVLFSEAKKRFELRTCDVDEQGKPDEKWKSVSIWLFDPEGDGLSEAENIAADFVETIQGPKRVAEIKTKKKRKKDDENNVDPVFLFNRFVGIFPELKDELNQERAQYGDVRAVTFARSNLLPKLEALCAQPSKQDQVKRCCDLLGDQYIAGDMDVRSIIMIVLLNGLSESALKNMEPFFGDDLKKAYLSARKIRGKKFKPEKKKKQKRFVADNLNTLQR